MSLKLSFSHSKWVLQVILSLTVLSNCVSSSLYFDTTFIFGFTWLCSGFFMLLDRKFIKDSKNVLKTDIF